LKSEYEFRNINSKKRHIAALILTAILISASIATLQEIRLVDAQNASANTSINSTNATIADNATTDLTSEVSTLPTVGAIIPNQWVVTLRPNATIESQQAERSLAALGSEAASAGVQINQSLPQLGILVVETQPSAIGALAALQENPNVLDIEPNRVVGISQQTLPTGIDRIDAEPDGTTAKSNSTARSANATIAIIDTGIDLEHPDLNVIRDVSFVGTPSGDDDQGHGTHVAGIAAAKDDSRGVVGVAPGSNLIAVKVLDSQGSGTTASVLQGIDYVIANANDTDVANLSLGGSFSTALNTAVQRAVERGVPMIVAAGNEDTDASTTSPASAPDAITVSAIVDTDGKCGGQGPPVRIWGVSNPDDSFVIFSNHGEVVDVTAPGTRINSTVPLSINPIGYDVLSGTSMAAPHVTGVAALLKSARPNSTPEEVRDAILSLATVPTIECTSGDNPGYLVDRTQDGDDIAEPLLYMRGLR
jgi:subtilisin